VLAIALGFVLLLAGVAGVAGIKENGAHEFASLLLVLGVVGFALLVLATQHEYSRNKARDQADASRVLTAGPRTAAMIVVVILAVLAVLWTVARALSPYLDS
jgi:uncharacterized membrane protein HdeD (DUF308 family)